MSYRSRDRSRERDRHGSRDRGREIEAGKVFLGGLDERTTKEDVENFCYKYGELVMAWVARRPPGFAFVEFKDPRDAEDAVRELDGKELLGRRVRVEAADSRGRRGGGRKSEACYECGRTGHFARDCRDKDRGDRRGSYSRRDSHSRSPPRRKRSFSRSRSPPRGRHYD